MYLCDMTAFSFWFGEYAANLCLATYPSVRSLADASAAAHDVDVRRLRRLGIHDAPVHVLVPDHASVRRSEQVLAHEWSGPYPDRSFVCLAPGLFAESPALCLLRSAKRLGLAQLVLCIDQLCGAYRLVAGEIRPREPLVALDDLGAYACTAQGMRGIKLFRRALRYACAGAASPREAALAAFLRLPLSLGGCGLAPCALNEPVLFDSDGRPVRYGDVVWALVKLILEYDSELFHTGAEKIGRDAARRAELEAAGWRVVTLTNWQIAHEEELFCVVDLLRAQLGAEPLPLDDPEYLRKSRVLRQMLFGV